MPSKYEYYTPLLTNEYILSIPDDQWLLTPASKAFNSRIKFIQIMKHKDQRYVLIKNILSNDF